MKKKPRSKNLLGMSFLDCICCGFGAVILLFVLVNARMQEDRNEETSELRAEVDKIALDVFEGKRNMVEIKNTLEETTNENVKVEGETTRVLKEIDEAEKARDEAERFAAKSNHVNELTHDLEALKKALEKRGIDGGLVETEKGFEAALEQTRGKPEKRQKISEMRNEGRHILYLVDVSGSMLGRSLDDILFYRGKPPAERKKGRKWTQSIDAMEYFMNMMPREAEKFQMYFYNDQTRPAVDGTLNQWLDATDVKLRKACLDAMKERAPDQGTNLEEAFKAIYALDPLPDLIYLFGDGLPTRSTTDPPKKWVEGSDRLLYYQRAENVLRKPYIPMNVILYPMEGDIHSGQTYWNLVYMTKGSFICPPADWP